MQCEILSFAGIKAVSRVMYTSGEYFEKNPTWDVEDSPWKAKQILRIIGRNNIMPQTICEVGCGAGEILIQLQKNMSKEKEFWGYEISAQAFELCKKKNNERVHYKLADILEEKNVFFDLILLIDVIEHLEDYFAFLREIKHKSQYKILHIPLELSAQAIMRGSPIMNSRKLVCHLHYFTKETALQILEDVGYEILDYFYTASSIEAPLRSIKTYLARLPRRILFAIHKDFAVRLLGGRSLMVLAK